jgi:hypothetical protein
MEKLSALFGGPAFVRTTRLFLLHPATLYSTRTLREKTHASADELRPVVRDLLRATVIRKRGAGFVLNNECPFLIPLRDLLIGEMLADLNLAKRFDRIGLIKLLIASGAFMDESESRTDILVVADKLDLRGLRKAVTALETDIGQDIRYTAFTPKEFNYRLGVNDKLVRDILDYPHEKLVNKIIPV